MLFWFALLSAFGCALCNGVAAVLQKISTDKAARFTSANVNLLWRMLQDWPFLLGTLLDGAAGGLTLIAVHSLPLFVVQPIIALSVVVTCLVERYVFHKILGRRTVMAIALIMLGLLLLASNAAVENAHQVTGLTRSVIIITPLLLGLVGAILAKIEHHFATMALAATAGVGFGGGAIAGRLLTFPPPYWHILLNPLFISWLAYGLVGILLFTIALQRNRASVVNAAMITFETIAPILVGILLLGDTPRHGSWLIVIIGASIALSGTLLITLVQNKGTSN